MKGTIAVPANQIEPYLMAIHDILLANYVSQIEAADMDAGTVAPSRTVMEYRVFSAFAHYLYYRYSGGEESVPLDYIVHEYLYGGFIRKDTYASIMQEIARQFHLAGNNVLGFLNELVYQLTYDGSVLEEVNVYPTSIPNLFVVEASTESVESHFEQDTVEFGTLGTRQSPTPYTTQSLNDTTWHDQDAWGLL